MKIIDLEMARAIRGLANQVDEVALRRELKQIAEIDNQFIERRERERLMVRKTISYLPTNCRILLFLKFWEGQSLSEISRTIAIDFEDVRRLFLVSLAYLERELGPYMTNDEFFIEGNFAKA